MAEEENRPAEGHPQLAAWPEQRPQTTRPQTQPPQTQPPQTQPPAPPPAPRVPWLSIALIALVVGLIGGLLGGILGTAVVEVSTGHLAGRVGSGVGNGSGSGFVPAPTLQAPSGPVAGGRAANPVVGVARLVLPSVVSIDVRGSAEEVSGSGFAYDDRGHVVTNNHVIEPAVGGGVIRVLLPNGDTVHASIVGRSMSYDIAVLKLSRGAALRPATLGNSDDLQVGQTVVVIGSPLGLNSTVTSGIISATHRPVTAGGHGETSYLSAIQTDAAINPGNSGGPLVNLDGQVIGVNSAIATLGGGSTGQTGNIGVGFSIPIDQVAHTVRQILATGHAEYPVIGARVSVVTSTSGARVESVTPGGPADRAGVQAGDLITAVDGHSVSDGVELIVAIRSYAPGQLIRLTDRRNGATSTIPVRLGRQIG